MDIITLVIGTVGVVAAVVGIVITSYMLYRHLRR